MCDKAGIKFYQIVELTVPNGTLGQLDFPDVPNLRNDEDQKVVITDIEFFPITVYAFSRLNQVTPGPTSADLPNISLTIYNANEQNINGIPILKLNYTQSDPAAFIPFQQERARFEQLERVAWLKCFVQYTAVSTGGPYVLPFGITYMKWKLKE
jgi:hypothetical protein